MWIDGWGMSWIFAFSESPSPRPPAPSATVAAVATISANAIVAAAEVWLEIPAAAASSSPGRRVAVILAAVVSWCGLVITTPARIWPRSCSLNCPASAAGAVAGIGVTVLSLSPGGGHDLPDGWTGSEIQATFAAVSAFSRFSPGPQISSIPSTIVYLGKFDLSSSRTRFRSFSRILT